jgi:plastocyanin
MKKIILIAVLFVGAITGFSKTWIINNVGFTFSPASITITLGDTVNFVLDPIHDVVEVSLATWNADGTTPLPGGFTTGFGGGKVFPAKLTVGTHYYVCGVHAVDGMKGVIIVNTATGITQSLDNLDISVFPNPAKDFIVVKTDNRLSGSKYFLTNLEGMQILAGMINSETTIVDISLFDKGIYLFRVSGPGQRTFKIIKD